MREALNDFSRRFAEALFRAIPSLEPHGSVDSSPDVEPGALIVELAPNPHDPNRTFYVSTDNGEVTVGFGKFFHQHFDWPREYEDPIAFIRDLIAERMFVQVTMRDGKWIRSTTIDASEVDALALPQAGEAVHIYSWSGDGDRFTEG
jgi:hypothetical protein